MDQDTNNSLNQTEQHVWSRASSFVPALRATLTFKTNFTQLHGLFANSSRWVTLDEVQLGISDQDKYITKLMGTIYNRTVKWEITAKRDAWDDPICWEFVMKFNE